MAAELIGIRRSVERPLPHMSWFHKYKLGAVDGLGDDATSEDNSCCSGADSIT